RRRRGNRHDSVEYEQRRPSQTAPGPRRKEKVEYPIVLRYVFLQERSNAPTKRLGRSARDGTRGIGRRVRWKSGNVEHLGSAVIARGRAGRSEGRHGERRQRQRQGSPRRHRAEE